jgi:redox-sensitive bicupin YhaK (pirin superfamily)
MERRVRSDLHRQIDLRLPTRREGARRPFQIARFADQGHMLDGHMLHEDHLGHQGHLKSGGAQWMTAGRGIIHSEMPQQESGRLRGFQLWIVMNAREEIEQAISDYQSGRLA